MRKSILISLFFAIQIFIYGQNYNTAIGIKLSPGIATLNPGLVTNTFDYSRFSTSGGLVITQRIFKDKLFLESGLHFVDRGDKHHEYIINSAGLIAGDKGIYRKHDFYLCLPISLIFNYKGFFIGAGPNINYFLVGETISKYEQTITYKESYYGDFILGGQFFLGYEIKLCNKFLMSFDGFLDHPFTGHYLNYGIDVGFKYSLHKKRNNIVSVHQSTSCQPFSV
jgi:hypothetical protein